MSLKDLMLDFQQSIGLMLYKFLIRSAPPIILNYNILHIRKKIDVKKMIDASKYFLGKHDFTSFRSTTCQSSNPIKTINEIKFKEKKRRNILIMQISAKSFLHNQVRIIVGSLIKVGFNEWSPEKLEKF